MGNGRTVDNSSFIRMGDTGISGYKAVAKRFAFSAVIQDAVVKRLAFGIAAPGHTASGHPL